MLRTLFFTCCFFSLSLVVVGQIKDCKQITSCNAENNLTFSGGTTGSKITIGFIRCSDGIDAGGLGEACINGGSADCSKSGCESRCDINGYSHTYYNCQDILQINSQECPACKPTPRPTPGTVAGTTFACAFPMNNFSDVPCPYGYTPDSTNYYCCRTGCPIPPTDPECLGMKNECELEGGIWKGCCNGCFSPIVIDTAGNGFNLTDGNNGVDLDLTGEGTKDRVAWTSADSDDAWLVLDRNGNGTVDNALELFGNFTAQDQAIPIKERNGFYALAEFDKPTNGGDGNGRINRRDRVFADLRLWQDTNHNGISEPNELKMLDDLDVRAIDLDFKETRRKDEHGNRFKYRARVRDEKDADVGRFAWDVFPVRPR